VKICRAQQVTALHGTLGEYAARHACQRKGSTIFHGRAGLLELIHDGLQVVESITALAAGCVAVQCLLKGVHGCRQLALSPKQL